MDPSSDTALATGHDINTYTSYPAQRSHPVHAEFNHHHLPPSSPSIDAPDYYVVDAQHAYVDGQGVGRTAPCSQRLHQTRCY